MGLISLTQNQAAYWGSAAPPTPVAPTQASAAGYNSRIFFDDFLSAVNIDMANSQTGGFLWYLANWFSHGSTATNANNITVANSTLTIGSGTGTSPNIVSAFDLAQTNAFKGTVFGTGGYFEIRMKFDPTLSGGSAGGIPNFFGMAIEHIADNSTIGLAQWPGQAPGFAHFAEVDFFEPLGSSTTTYNAATHDWSGIASGGVFPTNIANLASNVVTVGAVDFTQFHTYGCLWVPQVGNTPGHLQRYFDDTLVQSIFYLGPPGSPPLPGNAGQSFSPSLIGQADRTYSVIDGQRLALSLGGGSSWPIQVDWVKVWK